MRKILHRFLWLILGLSPSSGFTQSLTEAQGEMVGVIRFDAMVLDSYYSKCRHNGDPYNKNLQNVRSLLKKKWGSTFDDIVTRIEKRNGVEYKTEADRLIDAAISRFQGCNSKGMELFSNHIENKTRDNLNKFHEIR